MVWIQYLTEGIRTTYFIYESSVDLSDHLLKCSTSKSFKKKIIISCSADCISFVTTRDISQIFIFMFITR